MSVIHEMKPNIFHEFELLLSQMIMIRLQLWIVIYERQRRVHDVIAQTLELVDGISSGEIIMVLKEIVLLVNVLMLCIIQQHLYVSHGVVVI